MNILTEFEGLIPRIAGNSISLQQDISPFLSNQPIIEHIKNYPKLEWQDVYKFVLQGSCGWTHLLSNRNQESVVHYLNDELNKSSKPQPDERLFDIINNETSLCRVNLRVWKSENLGKFHELWDLMIKAEKTTQKTTDIFQKEWSNLMKLIDQGCIITSNKSKSLVGKWIKIVVKLSEVYRKSSDMPLLHHSETYRTNYKPSYRLVNKNDLLEFLER